MEEEIRDILRDAVKSEEQAALPLGSRLRKRFARIGLEENIAELRGQKARPAVFGK
jgi:plasmid stability protein